MEKAEGAVDITGMRMTEEGNHGMVVEKAQKKIPVTVANVAFVEVAAGKTVEKGSITIPAIVARKLLVINIL